MFPANTFDRVQAIFADAVEKHDPGVWEEFVRIASKGDESLRVKVLDLLGVHVQMTDFMSRPAAAVADTQPTLPALLVGSSIGPYKLRELLGEGGMGIVYVAEQYTPVRRKVALKVIKPGMDSQQVIARFESERQALALMDHPNIARVLDAGTTEQERPYFVMELVRGLPITEFCDAKKLTSIERIALFKKVCHAVQHAHQKGIIHRDIKPTNVLVTLHDDVAVPKVIDFGIAKITSQQRGELSVYTGFNQMVGTPLYMSPEQAEMNSIDVDIRSDVYSLGVLLYELITGTTPFDKETLRQAGFDEMRRMIRETDPPRPSDRLSTLSEEEQSTASGRRGVDAGKLNRSLRGELDWIVMKAMEKDRTRRYESASHFADDVQRYLDDLPVLACPPNASYKLKKFVRRYKGPIVAASLVFLAMFIGIIGLGWGMALADQGRRLAERREQEANAATIAETKAKQDAFASKQEAIASQRKAEQSSLEARLAEQLAHESEQDTKAFIDFLVNDILSTARPEGERGGLGIGVTVLKALEEAAKRIGTTFEDRPRAEAIAQHDLGVTFRLIGELDKAEPHLRRALELRKETLGEDSEYTLQSQNSLAVLLSALGRYKEALSLDKELLDLQRARPGSEDDPNTYLYMRNLASGYFRDGQLDLAISLGEESLTNQKRLLPPNDPTTLLSMSNLGTTYVSKGKVEEGLSLLEEAYELQSEGLGHDNPQTLDIMNDLARSYVRARKFDLAVPLLLETIELRKTQLGHDHPKTLTSMLGLAHAYLVSGRAKVALPLLEENFISRKERLGTEHPETLESMNLYGVCLFDLKRFQDAMVIFEELVPISRKFFGDDNNFTIDSIYNLSRQYSSLRDYTSALPLSEEVVKLRRAKFGPGDSATLEIMVHLDLLYFATGQFELRVSNLIECVSQLEKQSKKVSGLLVTIARELLKQERVAEAEVFMRRSLIAASQHAGEESQEYYSSLRTLGHFLLDQKKYDEAEQMLRNELIHYKQTDPNNILIDLSRHGLALLEQASQLKLSDPAASKKKLSEAEVELIANYQGLEKRVLDAQLRKSYMTSAIERLVKLYETLERPDEVAKWRALTPE